MRMWMVDPKLMCRKHLLGEHVELHMILGCIEKDKSLKGYELTGLIDASQLPGRHQVIVEEMEHRGYNHKSHMQPSEKVLKYIVSAVGSIEVSKSIADLKARCTECFKDRKEK